MRTISELTADTSGWEIVEQAAAKAKNKVDILKVDHLKAVDALTKPR